VKIANLGLAILPLAVRPVRKHLARPSIAWRFQLLTWFGCTLYFEAISWTVLSPRSASKATRALMNSVVSRRVV
jgi:hypothetical protein